MAKGSSRKTRKLNPPKNHPSGSKDKITRGASRSALKHDVLVDLPLDILCEMFKLLPPLDLLQLARTAKSFRKFLMNRASKSIWTHALSTVEDLPPCPDDLSEPQYTYLMFTNHCHHVRDKRTRFHVNTALSLYACYKKTKGAEAKKAWKEEQRKVWLAKEEHAVVCERYFAKVREREAQHNEALREKRREQIRDKLRGLGWGEELDITQGQLPYGAYNWDFPAKELTEEEWEKMEEGMIVSMEKGREVRLKNIIRTSMINRVNTWVKPAYTSFFFSQPPNTILPSIHEVCLIEAFRTPLCTLPLDQDLSADLFENAIARLPAFAEEWRNNRIEQVLSVVRKSASYKATPVSDVSADTVLPLASTIFHCTDCNQKITYPYILVHRCLFAESWQPKPQDFTHDMPTPIVPQEIEIPDVPSLADDVSLLLLTKYSVGIWRGMKRVKFDDKAHRHMLAMLNALGWSSSTTVQEMEEKQPYVECLCRCFEEVKTGVQVNQPRAITRSTTRGLTKKTRKNPVATRSVEQVVTKKRKAARWIKAIQLCGNHKRSEPHPECFAKLEGQNLALATTVEQARQPPAWMMRLDCFMCMAQGGFSRDALEHHLSLEHRIEHPDGTNGLKAYVNGLNLWKNYMPSAERYVDLEDTSS
ncbi:hypothetical protein EST38_g10282 [Candolleomyces aberdarensis]|uniref:F-box domain-containing protein n=1 Tax=Candolleomyces aberdarensis TaxID=2316362 RepID=A0A4Q2D8G2_9AGAR|nr:hypothetical protein EST38_g10282 [Candolleomyces aberdarensis]